MSYLVASDSQAASGNNTAVSGMNQVWGSMISAIWNKIIDFMGYSNSLHYRGVWQSFICVEATGPSDSVRLSTDFGLSCPVDN